MPISNKIPERNGRLSKKETNSNGLDPPDTNVTTVLYQTYHAEEDLAFFTACAPSEWLSLIQPSVVLYCVLTCRHAQIAASHLRLPVVGLLVVGVRSLPGSAGLNLSLIT